MNTETNRSLSRRLRPKFIASMREDELPDTTEANRHALWAEARAMHEAQTVRQEDRQVFSFLVLAACAAFGFVFGCWVAWNCWR